MFDGITQHVRNSEEEVDKKSGLGDRITFLSFATKIQHTFQLFEA